MSMRAHASYDAQATEIAARRISKLKRRLGVSIEIPSPEVHTYSASLAAELLRLFLELVLWPLWLRAGAPWVGSYLSSCGEARITCPQGDDATLEHEVRHHFCHQLRCRGYALPRVQKFMREYYWSERHAAIAARKARVSEDSEKAGILLMLSKGVFPESRRLSEVLAGVIAEASPWVSEGFASEGSLLDLARAPLKILLALAAALLIASLLLMLPALSPIEAACIAYLAGGVATVSYRFLRTLGLDIGALRWRWLRLSVNDAKAAKLLLFPPGYGRSAREILEKLEDYRITL
ncbi:MAG: hypothetical protein GXO66_04260 [Euryarchaeota archaeon]|nr:hypothetical protein [Euryarchaeota archaeon]